MHELRRRPWALISSRVRIAESGRAAAVRIAGARCSQAGTSARTARGRRRPSAWASGFASVSCRPRRRAASCRPRTSPNSRSSRSSRCTAVPSKSYYELLDLPPTASSEDIKKAFRQQIARYHPDKVQHLGKEFQDMAADRAAELTEAYRILSNERKSGRVRSDVGGCACRSSRSARSAAAQAPPPPAQQPAKGEATEAAPGASARTRSVSRGARGP